MQLDQSLVYGRHYGNSAGARYSIIYSGTINFNPISAFGERTQIKSESVTFNLDSLVLCTKILGEHADVKVTD